MNIYRNIRNFFSWIRKSIEYSIFLWNDADYDYHFILRMLQYKIKRTRKCIKKNDLIHNVEKYCKQMKFTEELIEKQLSDNFFDEFLKPFEEKWGETDMDFEDIPERNASKMICKWPKATTPEQTEQARKEHLETISKGFDKQEKEFQTLFVVLRKCIRNWWD